MGSIYYEGSETKLIMYMILWKKITHNVIYALGEGDKGGTYTYISTYTYI